MSGCSRLRSWPSGRTASARPERGARLPELRLGHEHVLVRDADLRFQGIQRRIAEDFPPRPADASVARLRGLPFAVARHLLCRRPASPPQASRSPVPPSSRRPRRGRPRRGRRRAPDHACRLDDGAMRAPASDPLHREPQTVELEIDDRRRVEREELADRRGRRRSRCRAAGAARSRRRCRARAAARRAARPSSSS